VPEAGGDPAVLGDGGDGDVAGGGGGVLLEDAPVQAAGKRIAAAAMIRSKRGKERPIPTTLTSAPGETYMVLR
jgi:hypothetical protein